MQEDFTRSNETDINHLESKRVENLIYRRLLVKQAATNEPRQRRALFRIKCKILDKACKVVVDSGSTDNVISKEAVTKLSLKRIPHEDPYRVTWLNKGQSILVNEQAWVEFSISDYKDKLLCDILPMDACQLFLGRPWKFDREMKYDGRENPI